MRKPVFRVSDPVRHKPGCTAAEDGYRLEISDLVTAQLICALFSRMQKVVFFVTRLIYQGGVSINPPVAVQVEVNLSSRAFLVMIVIQA